MARQPRILVVCGFGVGTSMILKIKLEQVLAAHGIGAEIAVADATTAPTQPCDVVFTSLELAHLFAGRDIPVVTISNFLNSREIEEKGIPVLRRMLDGSREVNG